MKKRRRLIFGVEVLVEKDMIGRAYCHSRLEKCALLPIRSVSYERGTPVALPHHARMLGWPRHLFFPHSSLGIFYCRFLRVRYQDAASRDVLVQQARARAI